MIKSRQEVGQVVVVTNLGSIEFEIYCGKAPKTAENFLELCERKYYNNTVFHRLIKDFMVQGGDPTSTGKGGESYFGAKFEDECLDPEKRLSHSQRGMLSMANAGRNTNGSQFFITFKKAAHLDGKHTVFGKIKKGFVTLDDIEKQETDPSTNRPVKEIKILETIVKHNPYRKTIDEILKADYKII